MMCTFSSPNSVSIFHRKSIRWGTAHIALPSSALYRSTACTQAAA